MVNELKKTDKKTTETKNKKTKATIDAVDKKVADIDSKVDILLEDRNKKKYKDFELDEDGNLIPEIDEKTGEPKKDKDGNIIYKKKPKKDKKVDGFSVRYKKKADGNEIDIMKSLASKYVDLLDDRQSYNEYVRKMTTFDYLDKIKKLELALTTEKNKVKDLEDELGMTVAELRKQKKKKK